jgi:membrane protein YqaA with SNARE-associated domain
MESLKNFLLTLGIPGVFIIAIVDSAGVPLPGGPDAVVMLVSWQRPHMMPFVALAAALGSVIGCYFLYLVGRKGGELALRRFDEAKRQRVMEKLQRNDFLAVGFSVLAPPPFPTKIFILSAAAIQMSWKRFVLAVFCGRLLRFLAEGYLGVRYGDQAAEVIKTHYLSILLGLLLAVAAVVVLRRLLSNRKAAAV